VQSVYKVYICWNVERQVFFNFYNTLI